MRRSSNSIRLESESSAMALQPAPRMSLEARQRRKRVQSWRGAMAPATGAACRIQLVPIEFEAQFGEALLCARGVQKPPDTCCTEAVLAEVEGKRGLGQAHIRALEALQRECCLNDSAGALLAKRSLGELQLEPPQGGVVTADLQ
mmetsp:Transcript_71273/g.185065  ORF Transcript_71273/g.185065 Transcript_71273/m.185065 type:complete len:145 (+) Transcript_71273:244-678(+)